MCTVLSKVLSQTHTPIEPTPLKKSKYFNRAVSSTDHDKIVDNQELLAPEQINISLNYVPDAVV